VPSDPRTELTPPCAPAPAGSTGAADGLARVLGPPTPKRYVVGTHRGRPPDETWSLIAPCLPRFGVTRVADVTGLDRVGIPVWMAVRPNSRTLSVTQGKGLEPPAARVSAAMEALEAAHAEQPSRPLRYETYEAGRAAGRAIDVATLPAMRCSLFTPRREVFWIEAQDLLAGGSWWVPYEMVHTDATVPWMPGSGSFLSGTNGLASGNTLAEALLHGVCEVIERDALTLWEHASPECQARTRIDLATATDPVLTELLARLRRAHVAALAWDLTSDVGVAAVRAVIFDASSDPLLRPFPTAAGFGCHPDRTVALGRALVEAAQSRLTIIAGSRDDFGRTRYRSAHDAGAVEHHRRLALAGSGPIALDDLPTWTGPTVDDDVAYVLDRLRGVGVPQVLLVDLSLPDVPVSVARMLVPGLEGPTESPWYAPGPRARAHLERPE
jgi:YcaO-like protein with predicted kinase domain